MPSSPHFGAIVHLAERRERNTRMRWRKANNCFITASAGKTQKGGTKEGVLKFDDDRFF